jgi:PAS domain S-box-containing protein
MRSAARLWIIVVPAGLAVGGGALALAATSGHSDESSLNLALDVLVGYAFILAGLVARTQRPENRTGLLLMGVGFAWFLNGLTFADNSYVWTVGFSLSALWAAFFAHALLAYPSGRLGSPWQRAVVAGGYVLAGVANIATALFKPDPARCSDCPTNRLLVSDNHGAAIALLTLVQVLAAAFLISVAVALYLRWRGSTAVARRLLGPVLLAGGVSLALFGISLALDQVSRPASDVANSLAALGFLTVPFLFLSGLMRTRLARADVGKLLVETTNDASRAEAQESLRRGLRDPTLELVFWLAERSGYVDVDGRPHDLPHDDPARAVTPIDYGDRPIGALVHDPTLLEEPELIESFVAAARLAIERDRLQAELLARLDDLQRERDFVRDVVNAAPSYFVVVDEEGRIVRFNDTLVAATGIVDDAAARGRYWWELFALPAEADGVRGWFLVARSLTDLSSVEARMAGAAGELVTGWSIVPVTDESKQQRYLVTGLDLTVRVHQEDALRASEERSRALLEGIPDNIFRLARHDHRFVDIRWADPSRVTPEEQARLIGSTVYDLGLPPALAQRFVRAAEQAFETREVKELEYELEEGGEVLYLEARVVSSGEADYYVVIRDVSDRRRAELALKAQRDFLSALGDATPSLLAIVGYDGVMSAEPLNHTLRELTGLSSSDAAGRVFWEVVSAPEDADEAERVVRAVTETGKAVSAETHWLARGGERRLVAWTCTPVPDIEPGRSFHLVAGVDVTERAAHENEVRRSRARIVEAGDAERRRLERNLHDGAQQRLVSLSLSLRLAQSRLESDPAAAGELLTAAGAELAQALEELRELARGIHPAVLTDRGLGPALESLADRAPLPVELDHVPDERLPAPVEAAAFYVVAESLTNVAKYADATSVRVSVVHFDGHAIVEVADDGCGGADPAQGTGLRGLVDRVEALNGRLDVESPVGHGTRVRAEIPC